MILGIDLEQGTDFCTFFFLNSLLSFLFLFLHLASQYYDSTDRYLSLYRSQFELELELELIQTQMTQKPMLRAEVYARALRASQNRKEDSV